MPQLSCDGCGQRCTVKLAARPLPNDPEPVETQRRRGTSSGGSPLMYQEIWESCKTCVECQKNCSGKERWQRYFNWHDGFGWAIASRIAIDVAGPFERSSASNRYILVVGYFATKYMKAFPLCQVVNCLSQLFWRMGFPRGDGYRSGYRSHIEALGEKSIACWVSRVHTEHMQTDGFVERLNCCASLSQVQVPTGTNGFHSSSSLTERVTGFSPFDLLYGLHVRGPLGCFVANLGRRARWFSYVLKMRDNLEQLPELARANSEDAHLRHKTA